MLLRRVYGLRSYDSFLFFCIIQCYIQNRRGYGDPTTPVKPYDIVRKWEFKDRTDAVRSLQAKCKLDELTAIVRCLNFHFRSVSVRFLGVVGSP